VINGRDIVTSTQITGIASPRKRGVREGRDTLIPAKFQGGELADPARGNSELLDKSVSIRSKIYSCNKFELSVL
jgi:hypothetical protein